MTVRNYTDHGKSLKNVIKLKLRKKNMFGKKDDVIFLLISSIQHFTLGAQTALHGRFSCSALHYAHANAIKKKISNSMLSHMALMDYVQAKCMSKMYEARHLVSSSALKKHRFSPKMHIDAYSILN